jgi:NADH-quinone oxidoreductase subunit J
VETFVFLVAAAICLAGALGVVLSRDAVHSALSLVATLFGVAVLFVAQNANFLAAVQVIIYAGAIVVLFLFVIMLLGVERTEDLRVEPLVGQRSAAIVVGIAVFALPVVALASTGWDATGAIGGLGPVSDSPVPDVEGIGRVLFTRYVFALEITSILLAIAVVGAVMLAKRGPRPSEMIVDLPERTDGPLVGGDDDVDAVDEPQDATAGSGEEAAT